MDDVDKLVAKLTDHQRDALGHRQYAMFVGDAVRGPGGVMAALRRRDLVEGKPARLTVLGEAVVRQLEAQ